MSEGVMERPIGEGEVIEADFVETGVPATTMPKCTCCDPPNDLRIMKDSDRFAGCPGSKAIYEKPEGATVYSKTNYAFRTGAIIDPDQEDRVVWPEEVAVVPKTDDLLQGLRAAPEPQEDIRIEQPGGSKPERRGRVDLGAAGHW